MHPHMHRLVTLAAFSATMLVAIADCADAQVAYQGHGERIEVLGLHRWTLKALQDSIAHRVPGQTLEDAACMVTLRDSLHFADALVVTMTAAPARPGEPARKYLVIKVIEPQDAYRVRWAPAPRDTFTVLRPMYASVILPVTDSIGELWMGRFLGPLEYASYNSATRTAGFARRPKLMREDAERLWAFLDAHHSENDRITALRALHRDGPFPNRMVAAAVLANFTDQDSTWWALADALRDGSEGVRLTALTILEGVPPRTVGWAPDVQNLRDLLAGTNVGATRQVMEMLARTKVSPTLAAPLLHDNGTWVLTHLRAEEPDERSAAHALLVQLHDGHDLGENDVAWKRWIASL